MYGTSFDGYLVHQRNEEMLREVSALRLEGRLRTDRESGARGGLRLTIQGLRLALSGDASVERTTTA